MKLINESEGSSEVPARSVLVEDETYATSMSGPCGTAKGENEHKTLGVIWNHREDTLIMRLSTFSDRAPRVPAQSAIFSAQLILPAVLILMKILLQELCRDKKTWNQPLDDTTAIADLQRIGDIAVPCAAGCILSGKLHGFSDASNIAYGAAVYLRMVTESGTDTRIVAIPLNFFLQPSYLMLLSMKTDKRHFLL